MNTRLAAFTLIEALVALGIFALAFAGLAAALESALGTAIEAREATAIRRELESRLAFCMVDPPLAGQSRVIEAKDNRGIRVEERLDPFEGENQDGIALDALWRLSIRVEMGGVTAEADTLLFIR